MSPNASHTVRPGLSSAASLITTLLISFDQEVLNQHLNLDLNLVTPEYPFFESPCGPPRSDATDDARLRRTGESPGAASGPRSPCPLRPSMATARRARAFAGNKQGVRRVWGMGSDIP